MDRVEAERFSRFTKQFKTEENHLENGRVPEL